MDTKGLKIIFAGGCFWGLQKLMDGLPGVLETRAGYANGKETADAHYERVCGGETGFKEAVEAIYNPLEIALDTLLSVFFQVIDPTVADRQGNDVGHQYQTGIYYIDAAQKAVVEMAASMVAAGGEPFMVEIGPLENFYPAEEYHQHYLDKNPVGYCHISLEKMAKARDFAASLNHFVRPSEETLCHTLNEMQYA
ncbi:MAG: peptide-methionine (S)-S-oxide reductase MsrA, partial [Eubacterium aggregans]